MVAPFKSKDKVLVLDFDHTLYDTDAFVWFELRRPMIERFKLSVGIWEKSYKRASEIGYTLEQQFKELTDILGVPPCEFTEMEALGQKVDFDRYLFPDVVPFIKEAREKNYKIMILSFGAVSWQKTKIEKIGLARMADKIEYVIQNEAQEKASAIEKFAAESERGIFVDNKGSNLDGVYKALPEVETYLISRVPNDEIFKGNNHKVYKEYVEARRKKESQALSVHRRCHTLEEIIL